MTSTHQGVLRIGDWRVDPALDEISRDGTTVKLEPRAMRVLVRLAAAPAEVVSVDQLMDDVWKGVIVTPNSLYQVVAELRRALGDDPKAPTYIANVLRRGYRLIAPVSRRDAQDTSNTAAASIPIAEVTKGSAPSEPPFAAEPQALAPPAAKKSAAVSPVPAARSRRSAALVAILLAVFIVTGIALWRLGYLRPTSAHIAATTEITATPITRSIAVLPFLDLSEKHDQEYFADGMSEELIDVLAQVPELRVPARTSSFYFKGKQAPLADIAKALGVSHVLEGSVRKSGETLRITAQLIQVATGYHEWSETFDRPMADVFKVQDEIASEVVRVLKISLLGMRRAPPATANGAAYVLYLRARALELGGNPDDYVLAEKYIEQSLALDPTFAPAWATLAQIIVADEGWSGGDTYLEVCARGRKAVDEALRLSSATLDGHRVLANILGNCDWNWTAAEGEYKLALALDSGNPETLRQYATLAWTMRRPQQAIDLAQRAVLRDPLDSWSYQALALGQNQAGHIEDSIASWRKALDLDPTVGLFIALLANAYLADGRPAEALATIEKEPIDRWKKMNLPFIYEALGRNEDATHAIIDFEERYGAQDPLSLGQFYACRHDVSRAIGFLQRAVDMHYPLTDVANRQACYQPLEGDPRYRELLRRTRLSD